MTAITIRNVDDSLKKNLRLLAARHDRSMEEEVRPEQEVIRWLNSQSAEELGITSITVAEILYGNQSEGYVNGAR